MFSDAEDLSNLRASKTNTQVIISCSEQDVWTMIRGENHWDGLICALYLGPVKDSMTADAKYTFVVAPGTWSRVIVSKFDKGVLSGPSNEVPEDVEKCVSEERYSNGVYGVVFKMSWSKATEALRDLKHVLPYHLVRVRFNIL